MLGPNVVMMEVSETSVRQLSVAIVATSGEVLLQQQHHLLAVGSSLSDPTVLKLSDLDLAMPQYWAQKLLGRDIPVPPPDYSDTYVITIKPIDGMSWGEVSEEKDLAFTASIEPGKH